MQKKDADCTEEIDIGTCNTAEIPVQIQDMEWDKRERHGR